jgi:hypothetical protein
MFLAPTQLFTQGQWWSIYNPGQKVGAYLEYAEAALRAMMGALWLPGPIAFPAELGLFSLHAGRSLLLINKTCESLL